MNINDVLEELYFRVRTTDTISWPFIFETNGSLHIAVVSYLETKHQPFEIYGISRFISYNNNTVNVQNCKQFKKRNRIIIDNPKELVSKEELLQLEKAYFATLEALIILFLLSPGWTENPLIFTTAAAALKFSYSIPPTSPPSTV